MPLSKVELYAAIRRDVRAGMAIREVQRVWLGSPDGPSWALPA